MNSEEKHPLLSSPPSYDSVSTNNSDNHVIIQPTNHKINIKTDRNITADDILNFIGTGPFQFIAFLLAGLTYFAYGLDASIFIFLSDSVMKEFNLTETEYTVLPATTGVSNVFGAFFFSYSTDRFGRVWPYAFCLAWIGLASIASAFANSFPLLISLRLLASLGIGGVSGLTFPTLIEFLPVKNRGKFTALTMFVAAFGLCISCGFAWWLIPTYAKGWRYYIMVSGMPMILVAVFRLVFYFESPRYLIAIGKPILAWKIFRIIAKFNCKDLTKFISFETFSDCMKKDGDDKKKQKFIFVQLLEIFKPRYLRRTLPISVIIITESFGYLSSQLFLPVFVERLNVNKYFVVLTSSLAQIPGVLLMSIIIEWPRVGRLNSLRFFSVLSAIFFLILAVVQTEISIPVLVVFIYFSSFPILSLIYTYISEVYPTQIRSVSTAYFYVLQALSYLVGAFISNAVTDVKLHWLFPAVWSVIFVIQFGAGLVLNYEPFGKKLMDVL